MTCQIDSASSSSTTQSFPPETALHLIINISSILLESLQEAESKKKPTVDGQIPGPITSFDAMTKPSISLKDFMLRILKFAYCSNEILIMALIYIDRITMKNSWFESNEKKIHRSSFK